MAKPFSKLRHWMHTIGVTFEVTLRQNFTDAFVIFSIIVQPMIIAVLALWMLRERGGDFAIFVVIGSGMTGLWSGLLFISGNSVTEERWVGTLENLVASPTPMQVVVLGKIWPTLCSRCFPWSLLTFSSPGCSNSTCRSRSPGCSSSRCSLR